MFLTARSRCVLIAKGQVRDTRARGKCDPTSVPLRGGTIGRNDEKFWGRHKFARDSAPEGAGFEPPVPRRDSIFETAPEPGDDKPAR